MTNHFALKNFYLSISILCCSLATNAQIINGSFEQFSAIPSNMGQWQVVNAWTNAGSLTSSPDFYHYNGSVATDLPETPLALVDAQDGSAIMGFMASGRMGTNIREYLQTELAAPLVIGKKYLIKLQIANGDKTSTSIGGLAVDKLGCLFTINPILQLDQNPINALPQVTCNQVLYSANWTSLSFSFTPDQAYTHMTFGLFGDDSDKSIVIQEGSDPAIAYYFVDNFVMTPIISGFDPDQGEKLTGDNIPGTVKIPEAGNESPFFVPNTFTPDGDGNNDDFLPVANHQKEWELEIYNKWGERVFYSANVLGGWDGTWKGKPCENGSYVWQISYTIYNDKDRPQKLEEHGIVNLVR
jgi:gliding motility-associated-like protein